MGYSEYYRKLEDKKKLGKKYKQMFVVDKENPKQEKLKNKQQKLK